MLRKKMQQSDPCIVEEKAIMPDSQSFVHQSSNLPISNVVEGYTRRFFGIVLILFARTLLSNLTLARLLYPPKLAQCLYLRLTNSHSINEHRKMSILRTFRRLYVVGMAMACAWMWWLLRLLLARTARFVLLVLSLYSATSTAPLIRPWQGIALSMAASVMGSRAILWLLGSSIFINVYREAVGYKGHFGWKFGQD
ncbi:uncharacterized protein F5Z01DRAFT_665663 [Emericellopsis atlantica]|uniref:Uncharacterized protein n=1 Tax=Emericellopsis atlantica TaxID=2614577 RepID=A0A9P7ZF43_9HYPO|nr:uncharacterized protein F5Z01DRAFT_665663 [Emericellopsis atlantica]KAG9250672.1 hypothetical protein F5Z01DRAFT_665663 [Emericellopsis atlantica]